MIQKLKVFIMGVILLAGGVSWGSTEYPVTFQAGRFLIPTLEQFNRRVRELHPDLQITESYDSIEYRNETYRGLILYTEGVESGQRIEQVTTYIEFLPGLWRLVYVDNSVCVLGRAFRYSSFESLK